MEMMRAVLDTNFWARHACGGGHARLCFNFCRRYSWRHIHRAGWSLRRLRLYQPMTKGVAVATSVAVGLVGGVGQEQKQARTMNKSVELKKQGKFWPA